MVGVNDFVMDDEKIEIPVLKIDPNGRARPGGVSEEDQGGARQRQGAGDA